MYIGRIVWGDEGAMRTVNRAGRMQVAQIRVWSVTVAGLLAAMLVVACGSTETTTGAATSAESGSAGIRVVQVTEAETIHADRSEDMIVLDVRTPEEFAAGHLDGAVMIDFYAEDFAEQLAGLDPQASYLLYCRSGNRSGQTRELMADLGFADVADIDGGIVAWNDAGLSLAVP